jgi:hypothetical protein
MYTVASERTKYHAKLSRIERVMVRKRFGGDRIVSKSGRKVAESLCLQKLFTIHHSIIVRFASFLVRLKAIVCVQMLCTSSMRFGHSFIFYRKLGRNLHFLPARQYCYINAILYCNYSTGVLQNSL